MYSHYGINSTTKLKIRTISKLLVDAHSKNIEDKLFQQWNMEHIFWDKDTFINFEDYKKCGKQSKKIDKNEVHNIAKEAIKKAESIRKLHREGGNKE